MSDWLCEACRRFLLAASRMIILVGMFRSFVAGTQKSDLQPLFATVSPIGSAGPDTGRHCTVALVAGTSPTPVADVKPAGKEGRKEGEAHQLKLSH